ncbi:hypothetical protein E2320_019398 [Naja naja]|nr:hypothetical protein E2320_019398 [Naja naja]
MPNSLQKSSILTSFWKAQRLNLGGKLFHSFPEEDNFLVSALLSLIQESETSLADPLEYLKFLDQLSEKMNLDRIAVEVGFDMRLDAVLARRAVDQVGKRHID